MGWRVTSGAVCLQAVEVIQELRRKESQLKRKKRRLRRRRDEYLWSIAPSAGERQKDSGGSCDPDSGLVIGNVSTEQETRQSDVMFTQELYSLGGVTRTCSTANHVKINQPLRPDNE